MHASREGSNNEGNERERDREKIRQNYKAVKMSFFNAAHMKHALLLPHRIPLRFSQSKELLLPV